MSWRANITGLTVVAGMVLGLAPAAFGAGPAAAHPADAKCPPHPITVRVRGTKLVDNPISITQAPITAPCSRAYQTAPILLRWFLGLKVGAPLHAVVDGYRLAVHYVPRRKQIITGTRGTYRLTVVLPAELG